MNIKNECSKKKLSLINKSTFSKILNLGTQIQNNLLEIIKNYRHNVSTTIVIFIKNIIGEMKNEII